MNAKALSRLATKLFVGRYYEWKLDPLRKVLFPENVQVCNGYHACRGW